MEFKPKCNNWGIKKTSVTRLSSKAISFYGITSKIRIDKRVGYQKFTRGYKMNEHSVL